MDQPDINLEDRNAVGNLDRGVVSFGLIFLAIIPTYLLLIFRPRALAPLLNGDGMDSRSGLKLGPGVTFVFTILVLLAIGYMVRDVASSATVAADAPPTSSGIRSAVSEGNLWRSIILSLPLYIAALILGVTVHLAHMLLRKTSHLREAVGIGLYALSTLLLVVIPLGISAESLETEGARANIIVVLGLVSIFIILPWQIFSFSRHGFGNSARAAAAAAGTSMALLFIGIIASGLIASAVR